VRNLSIPPPWYFGTTETTTNHMQFDYINIK
jgi:hypothetical protein